MKITTMITCGLLAALPATPLRVRAAIYVNPTSATTSVSSDRPATRTTDGSGLSDASLVATGASVTNTLPTHGVDSGWMWRSGNNVNWTGATVTYELGAPYDLTGMHVWNYNELWNGISGAGRGVKHLKIEYQAGTTNWITYTESMQLEIAPANASYTGTNYAFSSTLTGITAVKFTCLSNWATNTADRIGLSEVRFIADPPETPLVPVAKKLWIDGTTAKLYWDVGAGATNYVVKRSETSGTNYVTVANVAATNNAMEYWNTNLVSGTTYYYVIIGENAFGESIPSAELSGTATNFNVISDGGGSWGGDVLYYAYAALDGNVGTFYSGAILGAWVGIDLGEGNERSCPAIDFYPRADNASRMNGAQFQGSNDGLVWETLATVSGTPAVAWNRIYATANAATAYRYFRCFGAAYGNVAELRFLSNADVDDVFVSSISPADGEVDVAVDADIVVSFTDVLVDFNSLVASYEMRINSAVVSASKDSSAGVTTFTYANAFAYDTEYAVQLNVYRTDGVTNTVEFAFATVPDYFSGAYLIAPGIRNGGFELVSGSLSNTTTVTDFAQIDNWEKVSGGSVSTRYDTSAPEGVRYLRTQRGMQIYNLTDHVIAAGDKFEFKWEHFQRPAGVIVSLCYSNGVDGVTNIADSAVSVPDNTSIYHEWSGSYVFTNGHPAIGSTLGLMFQENPMTPGETTTTEGCVDKVRLYFAPGPSVAPVIQHIGVNAGSVSLMWDSENGVIYHILSKPALVGGTWTTNDTVVGDGSTISTNVAAGAYGAEFFRLEAQ